MIRRVVLWRWRDGVTPEEKLAAKEGLAYVVYSSPVAAIDFGQDLGLGRDGNYGLALVRDHRDKASWDAYDVDPHHFRVGAFIDTLTHEELTARSDYLYRGPDSQPGWIRHLELHRWRDGVAAREKAEARRALAGLRADCPSLEALEIADDLGWAGAGRADLVVEAHFADAPAAEAFLADPATLAAGELLESLTVPGYRAAIEHRVMSG
jgi:Stress responsive A/B Barrel Domain